MHAPPSPRIAEQRWQVGGVPSPSASHSPTPASSEVERFILERLAQWEVESAKAICTWATTGDMCSPDYQSQLRKARATLQKVRKDTAPPRDGDAIVDGVAAAPSTVGGSQDAARRRQRDKLAAEANTRAQAKLNAALRQQQREQQQQQGTLKAPARPEMLVARQARRSVALQHAEASASGEGRRASAVSHHARLPLAATAEFSAAERRRDRGATRPPISPAAGMQRTVVSHPEKQLSTRHVVPDGDAESDESSTLTLDSDSHSGTSDRTHDDDGRSASSVVGAGSLSNTLVVRRRLSAHVGTTRALRQTVRHPSAASVACRSFSAASGEVMSPPPRPAPPSAEVQPAHRRRHAPPSPPTTPLRGGLATPSGSRGPATLDRTASLSQVDPSLPPTAGETTAIFASRSRSHTDTAMRGEGPREVSWPPGSGGASPTEANATAEMASPIKAGDAAEDLLSLSSAGSYIQESDVL